MQLGSVAVRQCSSWAVWQLGSVAVGQCGSWIVLIFEFFAVVGVSKVCIVNLESMNHTHCKLLVTNDKTLTIRSAKLH